MAENRRNNPYEQSEGLFDKFLDALGIGVLAFAVVGLLVGGLLHLDDNPTFAIICIVGSGVGALLLPWNSIRVWFRWNSSQRARRNAEERDEVRSGHAMIILKVLYIVLMAWMFFSNFPADEPRRPAAIQPAQHKEFDKPLEALSKDDFRTILSKDLHELTPSDKTALAAAGITPGGEQWKKLRDEIARSREGDKANPEFQPDGQQK